MHLIAVQFEEGGEQWRVFAPADGVAFEIAKAEVRADACLAVAAAHGAVEDVHEALGVLAVAVAAHARLIHADFLRARRHELGNLLIHDGQERFGNGVAVFVFRIRRQSSAERVGSGDRDLQALAGVRGQALQTLKLLHHAQPTWRTQFAHDLVFATLVMRRWPKAPRTGRFERDAFNETVEGQIEIKPRLLAIRDDIQPGGDLILNGHLRRIILHFRNVSAAEFGEVPCREFEPARERVTADDGGAERLGLHDGASLSVPTVHRQAQAAKHNRCGGKVQ